MLVKTYKLPGNRLMITICDKSLIGKKFVEGDFQLDLTSGFFKGVQKPRNEILLLFPQAAVITLVGKKSVDLALHAGLIEKSHVRFIKNIPHAQSIAL